MGTITNHYRDSHVLNLGSGSERGPYLVTQTGVSPNDPLPKERMFVLRPDGRWVDFNAYACQGKPEAMDEIAFSTTAEVMEIFAKLLGRLRVLDLPVDEAATNDRAADFEPASSESSAAARRRWYNMFPAVGHASFMRSGIPCCAHSRRRSKTSATTMHCSRRSVTAESRR